MLRRQSVSRRERSLFASTGICMKTRDNLQICKFMYFKILYVIGTNLLRTKRKTEEVKK